MSRRNRLTPFKLPRGTLTRADTDIRIMRSLINFLGTWDQCGAACRRKRNCAHPTCACFDANREKILDVLEALVDWPRFDGPRDPEDAARIPTKVFD